MWELSATIIGGLVLLIVGFVAKQVAGINDSFKEMNGRFFAHVTESGIHHSGIEMLKGHIESVEQKSDAAHKRVDALAK